MARTISIALLYGYFLLYEASSRVRVFGVMNDSPRSLLRPLEGRIRQFGSADSAEYLLCEGIFEGRACISGLSLGYSVARAA